MYMESKWAALKPETIRLRKEGNSVRDIETKLGIPRSTLSGWLREVALTKVQRAALTMRWRKALTAARVEAVRWHNNEKAKRLQEAERVAKEILGQLSNDLPTLELALAMLYLGEGAKKSLQTTLASSDPRIAKFFIQSLRRLYSIPIVDIKCYLHLRVDQDPIALTRFWMRELGLKSSNFGKALMDKRTIKSPTYPHYKGVCAISCGRVAVQRRLMYIANGFCDRVAETSKNARA